ncbi:MAG: hypothetical protein KF683_10730 [Rubrivivax sp.]|nr:hypothetical protein [Rubrivivax sp.]
MTTLDRAALLFAATFTSAAAAQPATGTPRAADALDPAAAVPRLEYRSALRGYRPLADTPPGDWRALNEQVHRVGGWRTYLRQAHAPEPAAPEAATKPAVPAAHDHGSQP